MNVTIQDGDPLSPSTKFFTLLEKHFSPVIDLMPMAHRKFFFSTFQEGFEAARAVYGPYLRGNNIPWPEWDDPVLATKRLVFDGLAQCEL